MAVGAGGALTVGVNRFPPVGLIDFSVGVTEDVDVGVVEVSGSFFSSVPHAAVSPIIAMIAVPPTAAAMRRVRRFDMIQSLNYPRVANGVSSVNRKRFRTPRDVHQPRSEAGSGAEHFNSRLNPAHSHLTVGSPQAEGLEPGRSPVAALLPAGLRLTLVGGRVFTRRIEQVFE
jgi:hypothetical protein